MMEVTDLEEAVTGEFVIIEPCYAKTCLIAFKSVLVNVAD